MQKTILIFIFLIWCGQAFLQLTCPTLNAPQNVDTDVPVDALISWTPVEGVPGYLVAIGTAPGTDNILRQRNVGIATSIKPPIGLPTNTDLYITITLFFFDRDNIDCGSEVFRTEVVTSRPDWTNLSYPEDGQMNVEVGTTISWDYVPKATGYELSMGTASGNNNIIDGVRIFSGMSYRPEIRLPEQIFFCQNEIPFTVSTNDTAEGYRWFMIHPENTETLLSSSLSVGLSQNGTELIMEIPYRLQTIGLMRWEVNNKNLGAFWT
ncbi:hypothetical protein LCGC14_0786650 [marine sediment metagenome]|uniref:Fibronectin type-III domain-containing protein n=2 Tax=root TaxID=1 RepID=A0A831QQ34_9FLAO|nr:hypothetical protein [Pricia sp.]HEA20676.1 hypothetical protein [Pricia antarctica]